MFKSVYNSYVTNSGLSRPVPLSLPSRFTSKWPQNQPRCNSPFAESPLWETIVRNVYISFRQNITQWARKKFMAGWLHLYAVGPCGSGQNAMRPHSLWHWSRQMMASILVLSPTVFSKGKENFILSASDILYSDKDKRILREKTLKQDFYSLRVW